MHVAPFLGHEKIQKKKESEVQQNAGEIYKKRKKLREEHQSSTIVYMVVG